MAGLVPLTPRALLAAAPTDRRLVVVLLAIFIPGPNVLVILAYALLAFLLPEEEF